MFRSTPQRVLVYSASILWLLVSISVHAAPLESLDDPSLAKAVDGFRLDQLRGNLERYKPNSRPGAYIRIRLAKRALHVGAVTRAQEFLAPVTIVPKALSAQWKQLLDSLMPPPTQLRTVGLLAPLSGPYSALGKSALMGARAALTGANIRLIPADTQGTFLGAQQGAQRLITHYGVSVIIGPIGHRESQGAALIAEASAVPIIALSTRPDLEKLGVYVFRHRADSKDGARQVARHGVDDLHFKAFGVLYPNTVSGKRNMQAFWRTVESRGGRITASEAYEAGDSKSMSRAVRGLIGRRHLKYRNRSTLWRRLNKKSRSRAHHVAPITDFKALFVADTAENLRLLLPYLTHWDVELRNEALGGQRGSGAAPSARGQPRVQLLGLSGFADLADSRARIPESYYSVFSDAYWKDTRLGRQFGSAMGSAKTAPVPRIAAHAYDALYALRQALNKGTSRADLRRALADLDYEGAFGRTTVNGHGRFRVPAKILTLIPGRGVEVIADPTKGR